MDGNTVLIAITNAHVLRLFPRMKSPQCSILLCLFLLGSAANNKRKSRFFIGEMHYFLLQVRRTLSGGGAGFAVRTAVKQPGSANAVITQHPAWTLGEHPNRWFDHFQMQKRKVCC